MDGVVAAQLVALGKITRGSDQHAVHDDDIDLSPDVLKLALGRIEREL